VDGLGVEEMGRSINGSSSRSTGVTVCLIRLGVAVRVKLTKQPRKRRPKDGGAARAQPAWQPEKKKPKGDHATEKTPAAKPRRMRTKSQGFQGFAPTDTKQSGLDKNSTHSLDSAEKLATIGGQTCSFGQGVTVLKQIMEVAQRSKVNAPDAVTRARQYMDFLTALPTCLGLGEYTKKHLCRKHLIQHYASEPRSIQNLSLVDLLDILPDVGNHLAELRSPAWAASKWASMLHCEVLHLTMWPCLLNEALARVPCAPEIIWCTTKDTFSRVLQHYRERHGFNPSPRVLLLEVSKTPEGQALLTRSGAAPPESQQPAWDNDEEDHML